MRSLLIIHDDSKKHEPELLGPATAEVLRAAADAADAVLIPASPTILPMSAVIARGLARAQPLDGERDWSARQGSFIPYRPFGPGYEDRLSPFLNAYLGPKPRPPGEKLPDLSELLEEYPPHMAVVLTLDEGAFDLLRRFEKLPDFVYFKSLVGDIAARLSDQLPRARRIFDLEREWISQDERDPETGRSDSEDERLEPFIPFSVLLQSVLTDE